MRVLLTGGGTGGHINPALAIAEIIKANVPDAEIAFVGTKRGMENHLIPKEGYPLYHVEIQGVSRSLSPTNLKTAYLVLTAPRKAERIIREFRPDLVIGTGGYVCWPLLHAASKLGIPTIVHEANALPGMAVRQLQKKVDVILTNFEATADRLRAKDRIVHVGNPLRIGYATAGKTEARRTLGIPEESFVILSFGGSRGAPALTKAAIELMHGFSASREDVMHFHASGRGENYDEARALLESYSLEGNERLCLKEYIYDMPLYMAAADLVICRAGAMTLTELAGLRRCAILIPSPNVTDNHQYKNAKVLADAGAAVLIEEKELSADVICERVRRLYEDGEARRGMETQIAYFENADVGKRIYEEIVKLLKKKKDEK